MGAVPSCCATLQGPLPAPLHSQTLKHMRTCMHCCFSTPLIGQVLSIVLAPAPGTPAALLCAPRCAVIRMTHCRQDDGIQLLLFHSLPPDESWKLLRSCGGGDTSGYGGSYRGSSYSNAGSGWIRWPLRGLASLLWQPVLMEVSGGYTVVGLHTSGLEEDGGSCESMLTGILKVGWVLTEVSGGFTMVGLEVSGVFTVLGLHTGVPDNDGG